MVSNHHRLLGEKFIPEEAEALQLPLERTPNLCVPCQTISDRDAKLDCALFDFRPHFSRPACSQWDHLAVPTRRQVPAKKSEPRELTRRQKMVGELRLAAIGQRRLDEPLPAFMRQEAEETEVTAAS